MHFRRICAATNCSFRRRSRPLEPQAAAGITLPNHPAPEGIRSRTRISRGTNGANGVANRDTKLLEGSLLAALPTTYLMAPVESTLRGNAPTQTLVTCPIR